MKIDMRIVAALVGVVVIVIALSYTKTDLGLDSNIDNDLVTLLPGLFVVIAGLALAAGASGVFCVPAMGFVGVGFAVFAGELDTLGILTSDMLSGLTVAQLQLWIIALGLIAGGILMAGRREY